MGDLLARGSISKNVWEQSFHCTWVKRNAEMIHTLMAHIDINSISHDAALLCVLHRIDKVVDHISDELLNAMVRLHLDRVIDGNMDSYPHDDVYDPPFRTLFTMSGANKSLIYLDERMCAVQKRTIEQHLGGSQCAAQYKRM